MPRVLQATAIFISHEILNDDDDDIRGLGSSVATLLSSHFGRPIGTGSTRCVPSVADANLRKYLAAELSEAETATTGAIVRLIGRSTHVKGRFTPVECLLRQAAHEDTALFTIERQNLYVDEAKQARQWSETLQLMPPEACSMPLRLQLETWTAEGLHALLERAGAERDGPLGWTFKRDVFTIGMRVIYAAGLLLSWAAKSDDMAAIASVVRERLQSLSDAGGRQDLHPLWLGEIALLLSK